MKAETENIIRKVRKLLALADSNRNTQESEVNSALEMAHKLMRDHDLSLSDVQVSEIKKEGALDQAAEYRRNCVPWERSLAQAVSELFDTYSYRNSKLVPGGGIQFAMHFIGVGADAEISSAAYESLRETLKKMGKESPHRGSDLGAFLLGVAVRLRHRAEEMAKAARDAIMANTPVPMPGVSASTAEFGVPGPTPIRALMVVKDILIEEKKKTMRLIGIKRGSMGGSRSSYDHGYSKGADVNLNFRKAIE